MVDAASAAGADAIKFQTFSAEKLVSEAAEKAEYQKAATGAGTQFSMLKALELSAEDHRSIYERCAKVGIEFMSTPFDEEAAEFLTGLGMRRLKVPSGEIVNHRLLERLALFDLPIILSTGMATMEEIHDAIAVIRSVRSERGFGRPLPEMLTILHCTSDYPARLEDVNLRAMRTIGDETGLPIGYSDHTLGVSVSIAAAALGATTIEKHFTLDRSLEGPDHQASLTIDELTALVRSVRAVDVALGSSVKAPTPAELAVRAVARRSVAVTRDIAAGAVLSADDLTLLRPATGIEPPHLKEVVGRTLAVPVRARQSLKWDDLVVA